MDDRNKQNLNQTDDAEMDQGMDNQSTAQDAPENTSDIETGEAGGEVGGSQDLKDQKDSNESSEEEDSDLFYDGMP